MCQRKSAEGTHKATHHFRKPSPPPPSPGTLACPVIASAFPSFDLHSNGVNVTRQANNPMFTVRAQLLDGCAWNLDLGEPVDTNTRTYTECFGMKMFPPIPGAPCPVDILGNTSVSLIICSSAVASNNFIIDNSMCDGL